MRKGWYSGSSSSSSSPFYSKQRDVSLFLSVSIPPALPSRLLSKSSSRWSWCPNHTLDLSHLQPRSFMILSMRILPTCALVQEEEEPAHGCWESNKGPLQEQVHWADSFSLGRV